MENRIKGQLEDIETEFTDTGLSQINNLTNLIKNNNIEAIFSSDLFRTRKTSESINKEITLPLYYFKNFRGLNMGKFQGKTMKEFLSNSKVKESFTNYDKPIPGGESINDLISRFINGINIVYNNYNYDKIAVISHGAAISNIKAFISNCKYEDIDYCVIRAYNNEYKIIEYGKYK